MRACEEESVVVHAGIDSVFEGVDYSSLVQSVQIQMRNFHLQVKQLSRVSSGGRLLINLVKDAFDQDVGKIGTLEGASRVGDVEGFIEEGAS